jgi:nicotinamide riboside kinase
MMRSTADEAGPVPTFDHACIVIAVLGAECTGKTQLTQALVARLQQDTGLRVALVTEHLRAWCDTHRRTPRQDEQAAIAATQDQAIAQASAAHDIVVADTTSLMTALYSQLLFNDGSLMPAALTMQKQCTLTLVTALDLPWVADGIQRDGAHVQAPVMAALRDVLLAHGLAWSTVSGRGTVRVESALDAVAPTLRQRASPRRGLFSRLEGRNAEAASQRWSCELCDDPDCEHALRVSAPLGR